MVTLAMAAAQEQRRQPVAGSIDTGSPEEEQDYVTLAKAGGRKDLLQHREYERTTDHPLPYPRVEWFDHGVPDPSTPPDTVECKAVLEQSPLYWPLPDKEEPSPRRRLKLPRLHRTQVAQLWKPVAQSKTTKLPPVSPEPVRMVQLLSMDYQRQWLEESRHKDEEQRRKTKEKRLVAKKKLEEHTMRAVRKEHSSGSKSRFIMKRFANIPSKLNLPKT